MAPSETDEFVLTDDHFHSHVRRRMEQRGVTEEEVRETLDVGWAATDAKPGTEGRTLVFSYERDVGGNALRRKRSDGLFQERGRQDHSCDRTRPVRK
jgi:hypothetical protein